MIDFTENNEVKREDHFTAILVGADLGREDTERSLAELEALAEAAGDGRIKTNDLVMLEAMGGGFTWGSALLRW